jgi:hypothetical protein
VHEAQSAPGTPRWVKVFAAIALLVVARSRTPWKRCGGTGRRRRRVVVVTLTPQLRKLTLTAHVASSVGWLGAVAAVLALAVSGLASEDPQRVRAVYLTMEVAVWYALIPLSLASLLTGLVQSLGTVWGLFRHYWVLSKLVINVFATAILLLYTRTLGDLADLAADPRAPINDLRSPSPLLHAGVGLLLLLVATILAVFKPRGMTRYGRRTR